MNKETREIKVKEIARLEKVASRVGSDLSLLRSSLKTSSANSGTSTILHDVNLREQLAQKTFARKSLMRRIRRLKQISKKKSPASTIKRKLSSRRGKSSDTNNVMRGAVAFLDELTENRHNPLEVVTAYNRLSGVNVPRDRSRDNLEDVLQEEAERGHPITGEAPGPPNAFADYHAIKYNPAADPVAYSLSYSTANSDVTAWASTRMPNTHTVSRNSTLLSIDDDEDEDDE